MIDPATILTIFAPALVDAGRVLVNRFVSGGTVKPSTIAEVIQLRELDVKQFEVLQTADSAGATYMWVEAIRKLQRPLVVLGLACAFIYMPDNEAIGNMFAVVSFYLFGERTMITNLPKGSTK